MGGAHRRGEAARVLLAAIRLANGTAGLIAPRILAGRLTTPETEGAAIYPFRLFGVRTILIGAELLARDRGVRRRALNAGVLIHASDTAAAFLGGRSGELPAPMAKRLTALSGLNTLLALTAWRVARRAERGRR
jgi:hypothetical protein